MYLSNNSEIHFISSELLYLVKSFVSADLTSGFEFGKFYGHLYNMGEHIFITLWSK